MGLGKLYAKEMRAHLVELIIIVILVAAGEITAHIYFGESWSFIPGVVGPMVGIPIWLIAASFAGLNEEWADHTSYWLLSLPVREEVTLAAKLLAVITRLFLISLPAVTGIYFLVARTAVPLPWTTAYVTVYFAFLAGALPVATAGFLAVVVERAVRWGGGLTQMAGFVLTLWGMERLGAWLLDILDFLPGMLPVPEPIAFGSGNMMLSLGTPAMETPLLALVVVSLVLAALALELTAWLLRRWVEV
ncbi:MAG: hypothetical protein D9V47_06955 [Clostridia bacterium]|nr:MAG: hypothetical protein D9V47_06955 [Clostridia bacterium]